jgi:hypothetical protein
MTRRIATVTRPRSDEEWTGFTDEIVGWLSFNGQRMSRYINGDYHRRGIVFH